MATYKSNNPRLIYYQALQKYLELVQEIPEVVEVRITEDDQLYTIISAPRDDREIDCRVIDAQVTIMQTVKPQPFEFHLVNHQRLALDGRYEHVRSLGELVWVR